MLNFTAKLSFTVIHPHSPSFTLSICPFTLISPSSEIKPKLATPTRKGINRARVLCDRGFSCVKFLKGSDVL